MTPQEQMMMAQAIKTDGAPQQEAPPQGVPPPQSFIDKLKALIDMLRSPSAQDVADLLPEFLMPHKALQMEKDKRQMIDEQTQGE